MFVQYAKAVDAKYDGGDAGVYMGLSYTLANEVHDLLVEAQPDTRGDGLRPDATARTAAEPPARHNRRVDATSSARVSRRTSGDTT